MMHSNIIKLFFSIPIVFAENYFSVNHAIIIESPNGNNSYFGFSVQLQTSDSKNRVIVGAPRSSEVDKKIIENGKFFSCPLETDEQCVSFDSGSDQGNQSWSWLGFSVDVDDSINNRLLACAPKRINYKSLSSHTFKYNLNGMCYYLLNGEDISSYQELKPLEQSDLQTKSTTYHYIFGEPGFSSSFIKGSKYFVLSSIGLHNWTGGIIQYDTTKMHDGNHFVAYPKKSVQTYSYFGYSFAYGKFNTSDITKTFYVSGAPRSNNLTGKVILFEELTQNDNMIIRYEIPGQHFGEYFGASVAVADINGDNMDDILIGAPMHTAESKYERGRICLYITQKTEKGNLKIRRIDEKIRGEESGSRFGTSISNLGDINNDGFEDIAVGAPYYKNVGAIYIYLGQKSSLLLSQKIYASDVSPNLRGFGYSLSRGIDIDKNFNNDLAVGSYLSGHTVVLKSRPTISLKTTLTSNVPQIDIKTKSLQIEYCLIYTNNKVPKVRISVKLRSNNKAYFENNGNIYSQEEELQENETRCKKLTLIINPHLMNQAKITMNVNVSNTNYEFCKFCPFIDRQEELKKELSVYFSFGCKESICKPDLKISTNLFGKSIIIGSQKEMNINFTIDNFGENAFGVELSVQINPPFLKGSIEGMNICTKNESTHNIECKFNEHLETNKKIQKSLNLNLEDLELFHNNTSIHVNFSVSSIGEDSDLSNNNVEEKISLTTDVNYNIISKSEPEQIEITKTRTYVSFTHTYIIESKGQTELQELDVYILVPYEYNNKEIINNILGCEFEEDEKIDAKIDVTNEPQENINLNCSSTQIATLKCKKLKCKLKNDNDEKLKSFTIPLSFMVNLAEILDESKTFYVVTSLETKYKYLNMIAYTKSDLIPTTVKAANITMYIFIGIVIAIILLVIIGFITYKFGGFKKFKPPEENEEEVLANLIKNKKNPNDLSKENEEAMVVQNEYYVPSEIKDRLDDENTKNKIQ